jgi:hypothetical protein
MSLALANGNREPSIAFIPFRDGVISIQSSGSSAAVLRRNSAAANRRKLVLGNSISALRPLAAKLIRYGQFTLS